jgi:hypothetical protein
MTQTIPVMKAGRAEAFSIATIDRQAESHFIPQALWRVRGKTMVCRRLKQAKYWKLTAPRGFVTESAERCGLS